MRASTIAGIEADTVVRGFYRGYEGYFMPVSFSRAGLERSAPQLDARLDFSPAFLEADGEIAGFAFLALRDERAWIWALGMAPAHRRQGLGVHLLESAIANAAALGARSLELEVLVQNAPAQGLYRRCGFAISHELAGLSRQPDARAQAPHQMGWSAAADLLPRVAARPPHARCWQRQRASIGRIDRLWAVYRPNAPDVHAFYTYNDTDLRIADWSIEDIDDARAITLALAATFPTRRLFLANERASILTGRLAELGWNETWRQYRMVRALE